MCKTKINNLDFVSDDVMAEYFKESYLITNKEIQDLWNFAKTEKQKLALKKLGFVRNKYEEKAGKLTFAERKVNFTSIERSFDALEERFLSEANKITQKEKKAFLADMKKLVKSKDYAGISKLKMTYDGALAKSYSNVMKDFFDIGKKTASDEMSVKAPATSKDISGLYRSQALVLEDKVSTEVSNVAKDEALYSINKGLSEAAILKQTEKALDDKLRKIINASSTQAIGGAFNTWRVTVFETYPDKIYAFQYTAVLDARTTNLCMSLNGRVVKATDPAFSAYQPPNHIRCRSMWVEILTDEFIKPKIEGIPTSITKNSRTGYTTFRDLKGVKPYKPKEAPTTKEQIIVRKGIIDAVKETIKNK